jgi:hypothetical protein
MYIGVFYLHDRGKSAAATIIATAKARQPPFAAADAHGTRAWRPSLPERLPRRPWLVLENVSRPTFATTRHCRTLVSGNIVLHGDCVSSASTVASSVKLESTPTLAATVGPHLQQQLPTALEDGVRVAFCTALCGPLRIGSADDNLFEVSSKMAYWMRR